MKNTFIVLLAGLAGLPSVWAQHPSIDSHSFTVRAGIGSICVNDQNASPLAYGSYPLVGDLAYEYTSPKAQLQVDCQLAYSPLFQARAYSGRVIH